MFLHGAGTFHGWQFAGPWIDDHRVLSRSIPGYGDSGDLDGLREVHDLVLHYADLFDQLGLTNDVNLVGFSLGGLVAARFAIEQKHRLRRSCSSPRPGLRVPGVEVDDLFRIPPEELVGRLVHRFETLEPHLPEDPHDVDFTVDRYREMRSTALMLWDHPFDRVVPRGSAGWTFRVWSSGARRTASCPWPSPRHGPRCCRTAPWRRSRMQAISSSMSRSDAVAAVTHFCAAD